MHAVCICAESAPIGIKCVHAMFAPANLHRVDTCFIPCGRSGGKQHCVDEDEEQLSNEIKVLATSLMARRAKDPVPLDRLAGCLAGLAERAVQAGKTIHLILTGCNTCNFVLPFKQVLTPAAQKNTWVLCTNHTWSSDLSSCLWHFYGGTVTSDLQDFREQTSTLIDQFTAHWKRQNMKLVWDWSRSKSAQGIESLADLVHVDRMDRVEADDSGQFPVMSLI